MPNPIHSWHSERAENIYEDQMLKLEFWFEREIITRLLSESKPLRQELRENFLIAIQRALKKLYEEGFRDGI